MRGKNRLAVILVVGLAIRLLLIPHPGFKADIAFWKWWGKAAVEENITAAFKYTNYPPVYLYVLQATSKIYRAFAPLDGDYWNDHNYLYLLLIKLPLITADLGIAWLIYLLLGSLSTNPTKTPLPNNHKSVVWDKLVSLPPPLLGTALFFLNPAVIYNSAVWGQTDSLSVFFILLMYFFLFKSQYLPFAVLAAFNFFLKVQSLPFILLGLIFLTRKEGLSKAFRVLIPSIIAAAFINLPHILRNNFSAPLGVMINSLGYFPYASLNAYNLHWLLIRGVSDRFLDSQLFLGLVSHKTLGLALFVPIFLSLTVFLWKNLSLDQTQKAKGENQKLLFASSLLLIFASFLFMTEIHERYLFPVYVFGALLAPLGFSKLRQIALYILIALSGLINLHLVMIQNYPDNNPAFLNFLIPARIPISLVISAVNLIFFARLFIPVIKTSSKPVKVALFLLPLLILFLSPFKKYQKPARITPLVSLSPSFWTQQWGSLTKNKSVGGNLLAPVYYFHRNGIGTHAYSEITYNLDKRYSRFTSGFGVDIESPDAASVIFAVTIDDQPAFVSEIFRKLTPPGYVDLQLEGAKKLTLIATDGGDGNNGDHADWLEPTLYK